MKTRAEALAAATAVRAALPRGWRPRVWENLGWHYALVRGPVTVYGPSYPGEEYSVLVAPPGRERCGGPWTAAHHHGPTPAAALRAAAASIRAYLAAQRVEAEAVEAALAAALKGLPPEEEGRRARPRE